MLTFSILPLDSEIFSDYQFFENLVSEILKKMSIILKKYSFIIKFCVKIELDTVKEELEKNITERVIFTDLKYQCYEIYNCVLMK